MKVLSFSTGRSLPGPIGITAQNSSHVTPENESRGLTVGEIQMAKKIFKDSINYARARVHKEGYFPFGLQDANTAVTPNGEIYFLPDDFEEDFSTSKDWKSAGLCMR
jgi:ethanolamine utilization protein EutQ (cupin superfamily)